jgi:hypothetical protein
VRWARARYSSVLLGILASFRLCNKQKSERPFQVTRLWNLW